MTTFQDLQREDLLDETREVAAELDFQNELRQEAFEDAIAEHEEMECE